MTPKKLPLNLLLVAALVPACGAGEQGDTVINQLSLEHLASTADAATARGSRVVWADLGQPRLTTGQSGTSTLHNDSRKKAYLPGCASFNVEKLDQGRWTDQGPDKVCFWEGLVRPLAKGESLTSEVRLGAAGTYRLRYTAAFGCQGQKPMSQARCKRTIAVRTPSFEVTDAQRCGSRGLAPCAAGTYCDFDPPAGLPTCGADDRPGVCKPIPELCPMVYAPVCGCDGLTHSNGCVAASAGTDVAYEGECQKPEPTDHRPVCRAIGTRSEGWYWADTGARIKWAQCAQSPEPKCDAIGTRSEGWYSDSGLIVYDTCHRLVRIAIEGEPCGGSIGFSCAESLYCQGMPGPGIIGGTGTCRRHGYCQAPADCLTEGNVWIHPACVGHATCQNNQCGWVCGQGQSGQQEGELCGGIAGLLCAPELVCRYPEGQCQMPDAAGTCIVPPVKTGFRCSPPNPTVDNRVCACDGNTYVDACHAHMLGASILHKGPCA